MFYNIHGISQYISIMRKKEVYLLGYFLLVGIHDKDTWSLLLPEGLQRDLPPGSCPSPPLYIPGLGTLLAPVSQQIQISGKA